MLIEIHNEVYLKSRNLIKNFLDPIFSRKIFSLGFKENHLKDFNKKCAMKKFRL